MAWLPYRLRNEKVWARTTADGKITPGPDGRVDVLYRPGGKIYRAALRNLEPDAAGTPLEDNAVAAMTPAGNATLGTPFVVFTDGACSGNPGPCGIGLVLLDGAARREVSEFLGLGTNNVAELTAIIRALELAPRDRTVILHSDSAYALGLLGKSWKAKANRELVERMRELARAFTDLRLVKVAGHAGVPENERADALARDALLAR